MEQQFSPTDTSASSRQRTDATPLVEAKLDAYLTRTCTPLFRALPAEEAMAQRREMRSHLECLIDAYMELGSSETQALTLALEQFGKEQNVALAWKQECETANTLAGHGTFRSALRPLLRYSLLNGLALPILISGYAFLVHGYFETGRALPGLLTAAALLVFCGEYALFPGLLGYQAARRARGKALWATLATLPFVQLAVFGLSSLLFGDLQGPFTPNVLEAGSTLGFCVNFFGCAALGAGFAIRRRKRALCRTATR